jgi:hypothetical protein
MLTRLQQAITRAKIAKFLFDEDLINLTLPQLDRQTNTLMATATIADVQSAMATGCYTPLATRLSGLLATNESMPANIVGSGTIIADLEQLLSLLLPALISCIPATSPATAVTPEQVLSAIS